MLPTPGQRAAVGYGRNIRALNLYDDPDEVIRRTPLAFIVDGEPVPSMVAELAARRLPEALSDKLAMLLYKPDKNSLEWKALAQACDAQKTNPVELLAACGAIASSPPLYGLVADISGSYRAIWAALSCVLLVALVPAALLREH